MKVERIRRMCYNVATHGKCMGWQDGKIYGINL